MSSSAVLISRRVYPLTAGHESAHAFNLLSEARGLDSARKGRRGRSVRSRSQGSSPISLRNFQLFDLSLVLIELARHLHVESVAALNGLFHEFTPNRISLNNRPRPGFGPRLLEFGRPEGFAVHRLKSPNGDFSSRRGGGRCF